MGRVVNAHHGDTITILNSNSKQHRISFQGIDTPEHKQPYGRKSGKYLSQAVAGKPGVIKYEKRDRYRRIVGKVLMSDQDMNLRDITVGLAWHY